MKYHGGMCITAAILTILAGCSKGSSEAKINSTKDLPGLDAAEEAQLNSLRDQNWSRSGGGSSVMESKAANKSAVFHTGYLASMTAANQASADGTIEKDDTLPLATDTGAANQNPENRLAKHSSGALPTPDDDISEYYLQYADDYASTDGFVTDAGGNPSRVLTMWHSRVGRRMLERNQLSLLGFGSISQAQSVDLRVPIPPKKTFLNGELLGTFVLVYDTTLASDKPGIWPWSNSQGGALNVRPFSTDDDGTGCPISVHTSVPITSLDKFKLEIWNSGSFNWVGGAAPFTLWGASDVRGGASLTNVTLSFSADAGYFNSEICFVPDVPLPVGQYRMEIQVNGDPSIIGGAWYFNIVP